MQDKAQKNMIFSNADLRKLIIPLVIDQILVRTVGMADTMMISSVGEAAISGVSLVDMVNVLINAVFAAVATGGAVVASQYLGHGEQKRAREASSQLVLVTLVTSCFLMALTLLLRKPLLSLLFGRIEHDVMAAAITYLTLTALSFPFIALFNSCTALFRSMNDSKTPTAVSLGMNIMNLCGNALLIFVFRMGVVGAALSTLLSRMTAAGVMFCFTCDRRRTLCVIPAEIAKPRGGLIEQILYIGIPNGVENALFELGRICVVSMISTFGTAQIAANAVANNLDSIGVLGGGAINLAMLTVVGRCIGAHDFDQAKYYTRKLLAIEYIMHIAVNVPLLLNLQTVLGLYTLSPEATAIATKLVFIHDGFACIIWPLALSLPNALRAANDVKFTMVCSVFSMFTFRIAFSYAIGVRMGYGAVGVWIAMLADWCFRAVVYVWRFEKGKWRTMARI